MAKAFRTKTEKQLVREISSLSTRLTKRLANIEKRGLDNVFTQEARQINMSVKGLRLNELRALKRTLRRTLGQESTSVRGAERTARVWSSIQETIDIPSKAKRKRVYELLNKAVEIYPAFKSKSYRYEIRSVINKMVSSGKHNKTIISKIEEIASSASTSNIEYEKTIGNILQ